MAALHRSWQAGKQPVPGSERGVSGGGGRESQLHELPGARSVRGLSQAGRGVGWGVAEKQGGWQQTSNHLLDWMPAGPSLAGYFAKAFTPV